MIANATGCSSIYGGNLPTTPWATNAEGRGPAWSNSLFEDNAEFGLGFRLAVDQQRDVRAVICSRNSAAESATSWSRRSSATRRTPRAGSASSASTSPS